MSATEEIQILLRRKIPYISEGLSAILAVLFCIVFLFYLYMLPAKEGLDELSTAYYILVIPEWLNRLSMFGFVGLIVFCPLYFVARLQKLHY